MCCQSPEVRKFGNEQKRKRILKKDRTMTTTIMNQPAGEIEQLVARVAALEKKAAEAKPAETMTIFVISDELDKLMAAFTIASAAAAC